MARLEARRVKEGGQRATKTKRVEEQRSGEDQKHKQDEGLGRITRKATVAGTRNLLHKAEGLPTVYRNANRMYGN